MTLSQAEIRRLKRQQKILQQSENRMNKILNKDTEETSTTTTDQISSNVSSSPLLPSSESIIPTERRSQPHLQNPQPSSLATEQMLKDLQKLVNSVPAETNLSEMPSLEPQFQQMLKSQNKPKKQQSLPWILFKNLIFFILGVVSRFIIVNDSITEITGSNLGLIIGVGLLTIFLWEAKHDLSTTQPSTSSYFAVVLMLMGIKPEKTFTIRTLLNVFYRNLNRLFYFLFAFFIVDYFLYESFTE